MSATGSCRGGSNRGGSSQLSWREAERVTEKETEREYREKPQLTGSIKILLPTNITNTISTFKYIYRLNQEQGSEFS